MPTRARVYVSGVGAAAAIVFTLALRHATPPDPIRFLAYLALTVVASGLKLRLPAITGTYSPSFLFLLAGVVYFPLPEVLIAGCVSGAVQCLWRPKQRPRAVQVLFNMANVTLSVAVAFELAHGLLAEGLRSYRPAALAAVAFAYFVTNTGLVSGVVSLVQSKPLLKVWEQWYDWSFPYYLVGAAALGLVPSGGRIPGAECLILLPPLYLAHFFCGLGTASPARPKADGKQGNELPLGARLYVATVIGMGVLLLILAMFHWQCQQPVRYLCYVAVGAVASTLKVKLPGMTSTISAGFVLSLVAIMDLGFSEAIVLSMVMAAAQCLWRPKRRPKAQQVLFSMGALASSVALTYYVCRVALPEALAHSVFPMMLLATMLLYGCNTVVVSTVLCLIERSPLHSFWRQCHFWSFPYYLVGAAAAGIMLTTSRAAGWQPSLLVLPLMALAYVSYRLHVARAESAAWGA